jgi:hypothetical protein
MLQQDRQVKGVERDIQQAYPRWQVIVRWVLATAVGGLLAWAGVYWFTIQSYVTDFGSLERATEVMYTGMNPITIVFEVGLYLLTTLGLSIGFAQWFCLNRALPLTWSLASLLAWGAFIVVFFAPTAFLFIYEGCFTLLGIVMAGSAVGSIQWLNLRHLVHPSVKLSTWAAASVAGLLLGALVAWLVSMFLIQTFGPTDFFDPSYLRYSAAILASCLLPYSLITGVALSKILSAPQVVSGASLEDREQASQVS